MIASVLLGSAWGAIGDKVYVNFPSGDALGGFVRPGSVYSNWSQVLDDAAVTDNSGSHVVNPGAITTSTRHWFGVTGGSVVLVRLKYLAGGTSPLGPKIQVFGRDAAGNVMALATIDGVFAPTITANAATDTTDGASNFTAHLSFDALGCREVLFVVQTAFTISGVATTSSLQAKAI